MNFDPGIEIEPTSPVIGFRHGPDVFSPEAEYRRLDSLRPSLLDPRCDGPDPVYAIVMDVGKICHQELLHRHNLLFGVVTYASGRLGEEPIRSQGHVHKISPHCNSSTAEIFEIWTGRAIIYMQERVADDPGRCFAILAKEGDIVVVPPAWAHFAISANPIFPLTFAAFCVRDYGFEYSEIRKRRGLAWHPVLNGQDILWRPNALYRSRGLVSSNARAYPELGLTGRQPIYKEFERSPDSLRWVGDPRLGPDIWHDCVP